MTDLSRRNFLLGASTVALAAALPAAALPAPYFVRADKFTDIVWDAAGGADKCVRIVGVAIGTPGNMHFHFGQNINVEPGEAVEILFRDGKLELA